MMQEESAEEPKFLVRSFRLKLRLKNNDDWDRLRWLRAAGHLAAECANGLATLEYVRRFLPMDMGQELKVQEAQGTVRKSYQDRFSSYVTDAVRSQVVGTFTGAHGKALARRERSLATFRADNALFIRLDKVKRPLSHEGNDVVLRILLFHPGVVPIYCDPGNLLRSDAEPEGYALVLQRLLSGEYPLVSAQF